MELFAEATRNKFRFITNRGLLNTEDLWQLNLEQLNEVAVEYNSAIEKAEISFIDTPPRNKELQLHFEVVKYIIQIKFQEKEEQQAQKEKAAIKQQLLELKYRKEQSQLEDLSLEEINKRLESLS